MVIAGVGGVVVRFKFGQCIKFKTVTVCLQVNFMALEGNTVTTVGSSLQLRH